jgi:hypothetical protein
MDYGYESVLRGYKNNQTKVLGSIIERGRALKSLKNS